MIRGSASEIVERRLKEYLENREGKIEGENDIDLALLKKRGWKNDYYKSCEVEEEVDAVIGFILHDIDVRLMETYW